MTESIIVHVEVDGMGISPVVLGEGKQSCLLKDCVEFFSMGHLLNKERTTAPYDYMIRLTRHITKDEVFSEGSVKG